jgi:hypothetical protein
LTVPSSGFAVVLLGNAVRPMGRTEIGGWTDLVWMPKPAPQVTPEMPRPIICSGCAFAFVYMKMWMLKGMPKSVQLQSYVFR